MLHTVLFLLVARGDTQPPAARIDFPLPSALTDAHELRVRGAASDASGVAAVRVNGVPASTADGYATWTALVPLEVGENVLVVETLDAAGNLDPAAATTVVRRDAVLLGKVFYMTVDPLADRAWVLDQARTAPSAYEYARVLALDLSDGSLEVTSSRDVGSGPLANMNTGWGELEWDALGERLIVANAFPGELIAIDPVSGDRSVLVGPGIGRGPELYDGLGLALDPLAARAWVLLRDGSPTTDTAAVIEVDLATGERKLVASEADGGQAWPNFATCRLELLPGGQYLAFADEDVITSVEVSTGAVRTLADGSGALGEPWSYVRPLAFDPLGRAWVGAWNEGRVYGLDLASGTYAPVLGEPLRATALYVDLDLDLKRQRLLALDLPSAALLGMPFDGGPVEVVAQSAIGSGYSLGYNKLQALAPEGAERVWVLDRVREEVLVVELADGERRLVSGPGLGAGLALSGMHDAVFDDSGLAPRLLVLDVEAGGLVAVDPDTGDRTLLSGAGVGAGDPFVLSGVLPFPFLQVERDGDTAWVLDFGQGFGDRRLVRVDLATGDRTWISGDGLGSGPLLDLGRDLALDPSRGRALVAASQKVIAVDLTTGARSEFTGPNAGGGPPLDADVCIAWDAAGDRLLVLVDDELIAVDGASGERSLLYQRDPLYGPGFSFGVERLALVPAAPGAAPLLVYGDSETFGVGVFDLQPVDGGRVSGHHVLLSR